MIKFFVKDIIKYFPSQIAPALAGFISIPIITRIFLPDSYGYYQLVMGIVGALSILVYWVASSLTRFYSVYERDGKLDILNATLLRCFFITLSIVAFLFFMAVQIFHNRLSPELYKLMLIGDLVFIAASSFSFGLEFLRIKRLAGYYSSFSTWKAAGSLGLGILMIYAFNTGIEALFYGTIVSIVLILPRIYGKALSGMRFFRDLIKPAFSKSLFWEMLVYSLPLIAGNLAFWVLNLSDRYIIQFFGNACQVGMYSAVYRIGENSILMITSLFLLTERPILINVWEKSGELEAGRLLSKITRYYILIATPATVGIIFLSRQIMQIMTGAGYHEAYAILPFIAASIYFLGMSQRFMTVFSLVKKTKYYMLIILGAAALNIALNLVFVKKYGYYAAAVTTLIGYIAMLFFNAYYSSKFFKWDFPLPSLFRSMCASLIMGAGAGFIVNTFKFYGILNLILAVISGAVIYGVLLFLFGEILPEEKKEIKSFGNTRISGFFRASS